MKKILVTGGNGLVGNAIKKYAPKDSENIFVFASREDGDLMKEADVRNLISKHKPNYVIHTAAKVGGIGGNMAGQGDFFYQNLLINAYMIHFCHEYNVEKLLAFSSVCVFPDKVSILQEDLMHEGPPHRSNFAYANAKRMVDIQIQAYKSQFSRSNYCSVMPGNIFGPNDNYSLTNGHVIPSLIHKIYKAKGENKDFKVWGDGKSLREFLLVDDLAEILIKMLKLESLPDRLIVSGFQQYSISEVIDTLVKVSDFKGNVVYEANQPNGQRSRPSDLTLLKSLFPEFKPTDLETGLKKSYDWFSSNFPNIRT